MARTEARLRCEIWDDEDFRSLSVEAQWLYTAILTQKDLSLCGVITWTPKRFAKLAQNASAATVRKALVLLREKHYVVLDEDTDELWVRTLIKYDGALTNHNVFVGLSKAFEAVHSPAIRDAVVHAVREGMGDGVGDGVTQGVLDGMVHSVLDGLPEAVRKRVGKPFAKALALASASAPACAHVPPDSRLRTPDSDRVASQADDDDAVPRKPEPRRLLWSALVEAGLPAPTTEPNQKNWGRVISDLIAVGATPTDVLERVGEYRRRWPDMDLTINALHKHWDAMGSPDTTRRRPTSHNGRILTDRDGPSVAWIPEGLE